MHMSYVKESFVTVTMLPFANCIAPDDKVAQDWCSPTFHLAAGLMLHWYILKPPAIQIPAVYLYAHYSAHYLKKSLTNLHLIEINDEAVKPFHTERLIRHFFGLRATAYMSFLFGNCTFPWAQCSRVLDSRIQCSGRNCAALLTWRFPLSAVPGASHINRYNKKGVCSRGPEKA